ncbi:MAG: phosphoenolpyruvate--protein phosphotransferase [Defluviitaleaceae bacterium]|nr:phosphoenolpyruvate--protein phosphotransferase [Defluviitaleaceae bacterium]MCL2240227.1 phosphoenolpyruvate--protein phosphotransferase [Defluviitaleaceae bacterium]
MRSLQGIGVSKGLAFGPVYVYEKTDIPIHTAPIAPGEAQQEADKFRNAVELTVKQISSIAKAAEGTLGEENAKVFEAHLDIAEDPALEEMVMDNIHTAHMNAMRALGEAKESFAALFRELGDDYFRERVFDLDDVCERILCNLAGVVPASLQFLPEKVIVVAEDLTPSITATMDREKVLAFVTETGGKTSHTAIMARTLEIPAVVGLKEARAQLPNGEKIIVDGQAGTVLTHPDAAAMAEYERKKLRHSQEKEALRAILNEPSITLDGRKIELYANIGSPGDIEAVTANNGEGVGLFRTEFLYMDSTRFPVEEEQFTAYRQVAQGMAGKPVIIRTLDIGGDKTLPYFTFPKEENPFLGYRAIRMCLDMPEIFKTQLRAILRASALGRVKILLPMVISLEEVRAAKSLLAECKGELRAQGIAFDEGIKVGVMVETPAAVLMADAFAKEVDFFSLGTNDLTQYVLAVDRGNESINALFNPYHPAVLHSIKKVIDAAHREGKFVGMCGEFAGDEQAVPLLLGLGLDELSVSASSLLAVKKVIRNQHYSHAQRLAQEVLALTTVAEVEARLGA